MLLQEYFQEQWFIINYDMKSLVISEGLIYSFNVWLVNYHHPISRYWALILNGDKKCFISLLNDFFGHAKERWRALERGCCSSQGGRLKVWTLMSPNSTFFKMPSPDSSLHPIPPHLQETKNSGNCHLNLPDSYGSHQISEPHSPHQPTRSRPAEVSPHLFSSQWRLLFRICSIIFTALGRNEPLSTETALQCMLSEKHLLFNQVSLM